MVRKLKESDLGCSPNSFKGLHSKNAKIIHNARYLSMCLRNFLNKSVYVVGDVMGDNFKV